MGEVVDGRTAVVHPHLSLDEGLEFLLKQLIDIHRDERLVLAAMDSEVLSNLIAGLQLALTQPVRLDDVVIVEGEWGWIEEITSTYVVVRIWDLRRLVIPLSHFIEKPFENWTRRTADILGTVYLHTDYTVPLEEVRKELTRIVEASPHWDGKVAGLVVTNAKEYTLEIRALVSAVDSSKAWNLRCEVREKLIAFLQREYPQCLPRLRAEFGERMRPASGITSAQKNNQ